MAMNCASKAPATRRASVVLPTPGGPTGSSWQLQSSDSESMRNCRSAPPQAGAFDAAHFKSGSARASNTGRWACLAQAPGCRNEDRRKLPLGLGVALTIMLVAALFGLLAD